MMKGVTAKGNGLNPVEWLGKRYNTGTNNPEKVRYTGRGIGAGWQLIIPVHQSLGHLLPGQSRRLQEEAGDHVSFDP